MRTDESERINLISVAMADVSLDLDVLVEDLERNPDAVVRKRMICKKLRKFAERLGMASLNLQEVRLGV